MEYVQLEGIHIHEDGYAKFIELTLFYKILPLSRLFHLKTDMIARFYGVQLK